MSFIASADINTLLGCQILLSLVYAVVFYCMKHLYPYLRGAGSVSVAFFVATIADSLLLLTGYIPAFFSIAVAHCLLFSAFALFYGAVLQFFRSPRKARYAWALVLAASALTVYLTLIHSRTAIVVYVIAITFFLIRGLVAVEIFRQAEDRLFLKLFVFLMGAYAVFALNRSIFLLIHGAPPTPAQRELLQTMTVILSLLFTFLIGLSFLLMLCSDLLTLVKDESERDLLSGVLNRRGIELKLTTELKRAGRSGQNLSVALIDIDHFKTINDRAGHAAGDSALRDVVSAVSGRLRAHDFLGRFGGDEFLLVLPQTSCSDAVLVSSRIEQSVRGLSVPGAGLPLTVSIGITQATPGEVADPLLARADKALYNAKNAGRNCCRVLLHETDSEGSLEHLIPPSSQSGLLQR